MRATTYRFSGNQAYWPLPQFSLRQSSLQQSSLQQSSAHSATKPNLTGQLSNLVSNLLSTLFVQMTSTSEPRVWESKDAAGHTLWNAYDSVSDTIIRNASETEMRIWLETRHQF
ncbi:MAG: hypothetical protein AAFV90_26360 [Cyanobacteria bacterium J06634_5]